MPRFCTIHTDLCTQQVDAIVNAANPSLLGGGGVDGAIHRAAGPRLLEACRALPEQSSGVRCPVGEARITPGFALPASYVIHTVGPVYARDADPPALLAAAHRASLRLAQAHGLRTIAFPAISCGVYGYPPAEAATLAWQVVQESEWESFEEIRFVLFSAEMHALWRAKGPATL